MLSIHDFLELVSFLGVIFFAISGALVAAEKRLDILGFVLIGAVTGIGGGTMRDLLLGITPVFWVLSPVNLYLTIIASVFTYFAVSFLDYYGSWILWMDALGLAVFAVLGTEVALINQAPPIIAIAMGVMTATFGGIFRDLLCSQSLTLMRPELYISCAVVSAVMTVSLPYLGINAEMGLVMAFLSGFCLRAVAIIYRLTLPRYGGR